MAAAHEPLDRVDGVLGVRDGLVLGALAHEAFAALGEADDGGGRPRTGRVRDDLDLAAFHDRDHGVRRPEVDSDDLCHFVRSSTPDLAAVWLVFKQAGFRTPGSDLTPGIATISREARGRVHAITAGSFFAPCLGGGCLDGRERDLGLGGGHASRVRRPGR